MNVSLSSDGLELHDLFLLKSGRRITTPAEWPERRKELADIIQTVLYGALPPAPPCTVCEVILDAHEASLDPLRHIQAKILPFPDSDFSFRLDLYLPSQPRRNLPVILNGDGCWHCVTQDILRTVAGRGYET